jgi:hypothetical protein
MLKTADEQLESLRIFGYNDFAGHTLQDNRRCKCGATQWPHGVEMRGKNCFAGGGWHNFASDGICQDCGNRRG